MARSPTPGPARPSPTGRRRSLRISARTQHVSRDVRHQLTVRIADKQTRAAREPSRPHQMTMRLARKRTLPAHDGVNGMGVMRLLERVGLRVDRFLA